MTERKADESPPTPERSGDSDTREQPAHDKDREHDYRHVKPERADQQERADRRHGEPSATPDLAALYDTSQRFADQVARQRELERLRCLHGEPVERTAVGVGRDLTSSGSAAFGPHASAVQFNYQTFQVDPDPDRNRPAVGRYTSAFVEQLHNTYAAAEHDKRLRADLAERRIQILSGPTRTGRETTAINALRALCGSAAIARLELPRGRGLRSIVKAEPTPGTGLLVELYGDELAKELHASLLGDLERWLRDVDGFLVLTVDSACHLDMPGIDGYLIEHEPPKPEQVLIIRLSSVLDLDQAAELACEPPVQQALEQDSRPFHAAQVADLVLREVRRGHQLTDVPGQCHADVRERVQERLAAREDQAAREGMASPVRRAAFMLTCAALDGCPVPEVLDAFDRLISRLLGTEGPYRPAAHEILGSRTDDLLRHTEAAIADDERGRALVYLDRPVTADAILHVAWNNHHGMRRPIIAWLQELTRQTPRLRSRAGQVAGKLATYDFDQIFRTVILEWARSRTFAGQEAAAYAIEFVSGDEDFIDRVRATLASWSYGGYSLQCTVVRAYATATGEHLPSDAMDDLCRMASNPRHLQHHWLGVALARIAPAFDLGAIVDLLADWAASDGPGLSAQAARCIVPLSAAELVVDGTGAGWPALLQLVFVDTDRRRKLAALWRNALCDPAMADWPAKALGNWIHRADGDHPMTECVNELLSMIGSDEALQRRLRFMMHRWRADAPSGADIEDHRERG